MYTNILIFFNLFVEIDNMFVEKFNYILRIFPFCVVHTVSMMRKRFILCRPGGLVPGNFLDGD